MFGRTGNDQKVLMRTRLHVVCACVCELRFALEGCVHASYMCLAPGELPLCFHCSHCQRLNSALDIHALFLHKLTCEVVNSLKGV